MMVLNETGSIYRYLFDVKSNSETEEKSGELGCSNKNVDIGIATKI